MFNRMLKAKIHRATLTGANLEYEGSITIPPEILAASGILPYEAVWIWDINSGARFETYAITGEPGSSDICVNGAAARLVSPGDLVIIAAFCYVNEEELADYKPKVVFVDSKNRIKELREEVPGPRRP